MGIFIRVDDRLLHGQIICSWVPFIKADALIVASDEAASDALASEIIESCGCKALKVIVKRVDDVYSFLAGSLFADRQLILIVADLKDAMRVYESGMRFATLNIGNIHHDDNGLRIAPSVIIDCDDECIIERLESMGVTIDIRDVPGSSPIPYSIKGKRC